MLVPISPARWVNLAYVVSIAVEKINAATGESGWVIVCTLSNGATERSELHTTMESAIQAISTTARQMQGIMVIR